MLIQDVDRGANCIFVIDVIRVDPPYDVSCGRSKPLIKSIALTFIFFTDPICYFFLGPLNNLNCSII